LINHVRRAVVLAEDSWITPENLGLEEHHQAEAQFDGLGLKEAKAQFEANLVARYLAKFQGNVRLTAEALKTNRSVLYHLINKYELKQYLIVMLIAGIAAIFCWRYFAEVL
jgi:DNA-binding NtrC family response regulator